MNSEQTECLQIEPHLIEILRNNIKCTRINIVKILDFPDLSESSQTIESNNFESLRISLGKQSVILSAYIIQSTPALLQRNKWHFNDLASSNYANLVLMRQSTRDLIDFCYLMSNPNEAQKHYDYFHLKKEKYEEKYGYKRGNEWSRVPNHRDHRNVTRSQKIEKGIKFFLKRYLQPPNNVNIDANELHNDLIKKIKGPDEIDKASGEKITHAFDETVYGGKSEGYFVYSSDLEQRLQKLESNFIKTIGSNSLYTKLILDVLLSQRPQGYHIKYGLNKKQEKCFWDSIEKIWLY